jgi:hypothetical protein
VVFKDRGGRPSEPVSDEKVPETGNRMTRSVSYHLEQIKNVRNLKLGAINSEKSNSGGSGGSGA